MTNALYVTAGCILLAAGFSWLVIVSIAWARFHTIFKRRKKRHDRF